MEKIILNEKIEVICEEVDIEGIEDKLQRGRGILYVVDKEGIYLGCITRREMFTISRQKRLFVNYDSYKVMHGESEKEKVKEIFAAHNNIYNLPVIDENGLLLYEYIREIDNQYFDSVQYWEERYKKGGNSGNGSYNKLADFKAEVLNDFIAKNSINSVIEWGFGDGNQLNLLKIPLYLGYDVSESAYRMCKDRFADDKSKEFLYYDGSRMLNCGRTSDMAISLDVLYHLVEDDKFSDYLYNLFNSSNKYVCIYSSDYEEMRKEKHVKRRKFTEYVEKEFTDWEMTLFVKNPYLYESTNSNFYFYKKRV